MLLKQLILAAAKAFKKFLAVDGLHPAALEVVVTGVEHLPRLEQLVSVTRHSVLHEVVSPASALCGEVFEFLFRLGSEVYFHALQDTGKPCLWQVAGRTHKTGPISITICWERDSCVKPRRHYGTNSTSRNRRGPVWQEPLPRGTRIGAGGSPLRGG